MFALTQRKPKPLHHKFEDDLGELVDQYLLDGIDIADLKRVLCYEADHDHEERRRELRARTPQESSGPNSSGDRKPES